MRKALQIFTIIVIIIGLLGLALSVVATLVYADDGYPAPIDAGYPIPEDQGYPLFWFPNWEQPQDFGYPVDFGYPIQESVIYFDKSDTGIDPIPVPPSSQLNYREGRNLWQEIIFKFHELLDLIK